MKESNEMKQAQPNLEEAVDEVALNIHERFPYDGHVFDKVKKEVDDAIWDRISKEDHPPERAD